MAAFGPSLARRSTFSDAVDEFLDDADVWFHPGGMFRLFEVVEVLGDEDALPCLAFAEIEELEVLEIQHPFAAYDGKPNLAGGHRRGRQLRRDPHVSHHAVRENELGHHGLRS